MSEFLHFREAAYGPWDGVKLIYLELVLIGIVFFYDFDGHF